MEDTKLNPVARAEMEAQQAEAGEAPGGQEFFREKGDDDTSMTPTQLFDAGWSYIYHAKTGLRSLVNNNWLRMKLSHKDKDGNYIWSATPTVTPVKGTHKCLLHAEDPNREEYDTLGFAVCPKANLTSPFQVRRHMQKRHRVEWEAIEQARRDRERTEDREVQKAMMEAIASSKASTSEAPLYVSEKDRAK